MIKYRMIAWHSVLRMVSDFSFAENHWPATRAGEPTAHWSFLYTLYLVFSYSLFGNNPLVARILQAVIVGILHPYITYRIGEKLFGRQVGLISAGITALYLYFIYYSAALMTEPFYITSILFCLFISIQLAESNDKKQDVVLGIVLGISIGIAVLLRQIFLLFVPFLFLWIWTKRIRQGFGLPTLSTILTVFLIALFILPISFYNLHRFNRLVLVNTNSGFAFFWGNHPIYGTHFEPILPPEMGTYQDLIPDDVRHLDEAALDQELLKRGLQFVFDDPKRYILLSLSRIPPYFMFWPSSESSFISNVSRVASFGIMWPFMLYGMVLSGKKMLLGQGNSFLKSIFSPEGLLLTFVVVYSTIHILIWTLIRYRLPVDAVMIIFSGFAVDDIFKRIRKFIYLNSQNISTVQ